MKIRKTTEKIAVKVGDLIFKISPLTFEQKCEIQSTLMAGTAISILKASKLAIKYAVKDIDGLENVDGSKYEVKFDNIGLSDETVDDLANTEISDSLNYMCISLLNGLPKRFEHPVTKEPLKGVSFVEKESTEEKK